MTGSWASTEIRKSFGMILFTMILFFSFPSAFASFAISAVEIDRMGTAEDEGDAKKNPMR